MIPDWRQVQRYEYDEYSDSDSYSDLEVIFKLWPKRIIIFELNFENI